MALTTDDVARLAELARIEMSPDDLARLAPQIDVILDAVASVAQVAEADVPPMSHALELTNVMRADEVTPGLSAEAALSGAPSVEDGRFRVPRILGEQA